MTRKLSAYSTTAANNNAAPPDGFPEGMAISALNNSARESMARQREWYEDSMWVDYGETIVSSTSSTLVLNGDRTGAYVANRAIRVNQSGSQVGYVVSATYSAPNTTVNVTGFTVTSPTQVELSALYDLTPIPKNSYVLQGSLNSSGLTIGTGTLVGRTTAGTGATEAVTVGTGLSLSGDVLDTPSGSILQRVYVTYTTVAVNNTSQITPNGSAPTTANGVQVFSQSFTPKQANSNIVIRGVLHVGNSSSAAATACALFNGTTFKAGSMVAVAGNGSTSPLEFMWQESAVNTSARTYSVNYGPTSATTASINSGQASNTTNFGAGGLTSWMEILEVKA